MTNRRSVFLLFFLLTTMSATATTYVPPTFMDYLAHEKSPAHVAEPILAASRDREYRTSIRKAAHDGKVNFAGHYILSTVGCGSSCLIVFVVDAKNGHVSWLPFSVSYTERIESEGIGTEFHPLDFRADSRLLVIQGSRNEHNDDGLYQYVFERGRFRLVHAEKYPHEH